ncbi:hypothetical protein EWM64_g7538 [Hericium alpestre]|uniref:Uncharacterized protein n=1 Tax=Hericium alpestre TaxID=135208 RepID=A0A4Y9ZQD5_9AGAM|nr:hypothetical protein EWM64_g7538 [Hericium alpestre]
MVKPFNPGIQAAAQQIHSWERSDTTNILLQTLQESTTRGYLDLGKLVGAVARALLTMAYDRASQRRTAWKEGQRRFFSGGCHLIDFIGELFRPNDAFKIFVSRPDNVHDVCPFGKAFHHARLRFTHFVKLDMERGASTAELWPAFVRGMAFLNVRSGLGVVDLYIPVLLRDTEIREDVMTAVLIKVKHQCETGSSQCDITAETAGLFASPLARPYCTIVMELGTDSEVEGVTVKTMAPQFEEPLRPQKNQRAVHPRYNFCVQGCSDKVFKVLDEEGSGICASLLAACDGSIERPLEMEPSPRAVGRMIPVWTDDKSCYDWVKDDSSGRNAHEPRPEGEGEQTPASSSRLYGNRCLEESEPIAKKQARTSSDTPQNAAGVQEQEIGKENQKHETDETG